MVRGIDRLNCRALRSAAKHYVALRGTM